MTAHNAIGQVAPGSPRDAKPTEQFSRGLALTLYIYGQLSAGRQ